MTVQNVIDQCRVDGNVVFLPDVQLDRKLYMQVKKKLEGIGGKWNRKAGGFKFTSDPSHLFNRVQDGEDINLKKDYQFFETPEEVAKLMYKYLGVHSWNIEDGDKVLEPSAGRGRLIDVLPRGLKVTYCELNPDNVRHIEEEAVFTHATFACNDFMEYSTDNKFPRIIANPPFSKGQYCRHIKKMYEHLEREGTLVSVAPTGFQYASVGEQKKFREWLENQDAYQVIELPKDAFKSSGTMVSTCLVVIDKY